MASRSCTRSQVSLSFWLASSSSSIRERAWRCCNSSGQFAGFRRHGRQEKQPGGLGPCLLTWSSGIETALLLALLLGVRWLAPSNKCFSGGRKTAVMAFSSSKLVVRYVLHVGGWTAKNAAIA